MLSVRRATALAKAKKDAEKISIHALREEGDLSHSRGGIQSGISIHALREEGDQTTVYAANMQHIISIHALREEGDPYEYRIFHTKLVFLSTPSVRRATIL